MKNRYLFLFVFIFSFYSFAQENNKALFEFDYAQFGFDSVSNYIEFYYTFNQNALSVIDTDSMKYISAVLHIIIEDTSTVEKVVDKEWKINYKLEDTLQQNKSLVGVVGFIIPNSVYKATIIGIDGANNDNKREITEVVFIRPLIGNTLAISDVQVASRIIQDSQNENSIFYKNSMEVFPMPTLVFGESQPVLFYYTELYNLLMDSSNSNLALNSIVYNSKGQIVSRKIKNISRTINSRVEVGTVVLNKYPTDSYTISIALVDSITNFGVSSSKRFFVYNPSVEVNDTIYGQTSKSLASEFSVMMDEELNNLFEESKYIASSDEIDRFYDLETLEGKREFLYQFWNLRDMEPSTAVNEFYKEYLRRIDLSNQRFESMGKPGWKSDRGRVYIIYGEPSEIERFPNQIDTKPYEIWRYNEIEGGVIFVFADLTGFSSYTLIHSTLRGELRDDYWERRITSF